MNARFPASYLGHKQNPLKILSGSANFQGYLQLQKKKIRITNGFLFPEHELQQEWTNMHTVQTQQTKFMEVKHAQIARAKKVQTLQFTLSMKNKAIILVMHYIFTYIKEICAYQT